MKNVRKAVIVIEHLEPYTSKWMFIEIKHSALLASPYQLWLTNVRRDCERMVLSRYVSKVYSESIVDLSKRCDRYRVVILDPEAPKSLTPKDFEKPSVVVIGGIMGSHPPEKRTKKFLSEKIPYAVRRNIGRGQFTINGAVYVLRQVLEGKSLYKIKTINGLKIKTVEGEVFLPYTFPIENGKPVIPEEEILYIREILPLDEERYIREGKAPSIC